ncbi:hypothetical protein GCM10010365_57240 [Streptomyces poonensis]|uniref:Uncharacterized protein n=1 Tax=Streptomyces poonensis TaxID=68255 RepID=A0A918Q0H7_9ACTN|nr:hypothetical protein GCM10010365_57240 [Streptomyces poonensis]
MGGAGFVGGLLVGLAAGRAGISRDSGAAMELLPGASARPRSVSAQAVPAARAGERAITVLVVRLPCAWLSAEAERAPDAGIGDVR